MDLDLNGTADVEETLLDNGPISSDLLAWETRISDPGYGRFVRDDANSFACSGAMELSTLEDAVTIAPALFTWTINYASNAFRRPQVRSSLLAKPAWSPIPGITAASLTTSVQIQHSPRSISAHLAVLTAPVSR